MSADPNSSKKPEDKPAKSAESVLPPDIFYNQMLLFDMFANNITMLGGINKDRVVNIDNVYKLKSKEIDKVNDLVKIKSGKTKDFIEKITPLEIAQLVPKIEFSLVDSAEDKTIAINLVNPTDIGAYASGGYLQGGVVGLKSLDLILQGNNSPALGHHHVVEMSFVFDSINTFLAPIPNMGGLTYAQVFRTQGQAVSADGKYYRLSVSHSGVKEIVDKYNLNDPSFSYTLNLTPIISTLAIKENLMTEVKMKFYSYEENLLQNKILFDFIDLNLENSAKQRDAEYEEAKKAYDAAVKVANEAKKKELEENEDSAVTKTYKLAIETAKAFKKAMEDKYDGKPPPEDNDDAEDDLEAYKKYVETIEYTEGLLAKAKENIVKKHEDSIAEQTEDYQDKKKKAQDRFANARAAQIGKRLNEVIFQPGNDTGAIKQIDITFEQIKNYFDDRQAFQKSLNEISTATKIALGLGLVPNKEKDPDKETPTSPTGQETEAERQKQIEELKKQKEAKQAEIDPIETIVKALEGEEDAAVLYIETLKNLKKELAELDKQITELSATITTAEGEIGTKDALIKKYSDFNVVRYISFGDLLSLIMQFLITKKPKSGQKQQIRLFETLKKSVLLTCKVDTPSTSGSRERELYNLPISIAELELMLSKRLYGKAQNTYTIFELIDDVIKMANVTKQQILSTFPSTAGGMAKFGQYTLKIRTFSLMGDGPYEVMKKHKSSNYKPGFMLDIERESDGLAGGSRSDYKPVFYFGGSATGAQIKTEVSEFTDPGLQKAAFAKVSSKANNYFLPAFFKNTLTLFQTPIFHLGMLYTLKAPTIKTDGTSGWLFIEGDYTVTGVKHSYSAGGTFTTVAEGTLAASANTPAANKDSSTPAPPGTPTIPPTPPVEPSPP